MNFSRKITYKEIIFFAHNYIELLCPHKSVVNNVVLMLSLKMLKKLLDCNVVNINNKVMHILQTTSYHFLLWRACSEYEERILY